MVAKGMNFEMSEEELQKCMDVIDSDGNGTISFDEFALWFIGGKEGTPSGMSGQLTNFLTSTSKYNNLLMKHLNTAVRDTSKVEKKDLRTFSFEVNTNKFDTGASGVSLSAKFGITDGRDEIILSAREKLGFIKGKASHFMIRINVDKKDSDMSSLERRVKGMKIFTLIDQYVLAYNKSIQGTKDATPA